MKLEMSLVVISAYTIKSPIINSSKTNTALAACVMSTTMSQPVTLDCDSFTVTIACCACCHHWSSKSHFHDITPSKHLQSLLTSGSHVCICVFFYNVDTWPIWRKCIIDWQHKRYSRPQRKRTVKHSDVLCVLFSMQFSYLFCYAQTA